MAYQPYDTSNDQCRSQNTVMSISDPLDELISQLLNDPNALSAPISTPTSTFTSAQEPGPMPVLVSQPDPLPGPDPLPYITCQWVYHDPPRVCGASLSPDPKDACAHFRRAHNVRGNDRATMACHWYACRAAPMLRGSVIRHVLAVHLGLLRWRCESCGRVFSRKGTGHVCDGGEVGALSRNSQLFA